LRAALGAYKATPIRSLETSLAIPPIDLYLTVRKAAFEKRLQQNGTAQLIAQACQGVRNHLRKRSRRRPEQPSSPSLPDSLQRWKDQPKQTLLQAWKSRWQQQFPEGRQPSEAADFPIWSHKGVLPLYKNLKKADSSVLTQLRTGKIGLGAFLYPLGLRNDPLCNRCRAEEEDGFHLVCQCEALSEARQSLEQRLGLPVSLFNRDQFRTAISRKETAGAIARWFRQQELIPFYSLANKLEPG